MSQTLRVIFRIKNAKFSGCSFYMKTNIKGDFQICISVPLKVNNFISVDFQTHVTI